MAKRSQLNQKLKGLLWVITLLTSLNLKEAQAICSKSLVELGTGFKKNERPRWFNTSLNKEKYTALVIHGLNLKPSKMDSLVQLLSENGASVLRASLSGHGGDLARQKKVTSKIWKDEFKSYFCLAHQHAKKTKSKLIILGYSLGGLLLTDYLLEHQKAEVDKIILLAPALSFRWYSTLLKLLFFLPDSFGISSQNQKEYRAEDSTSLAAYRSTFKISSQLKWEHLNNWKWPTLIMVDPKDELIDSQDLNKIFSSSQNPSFEFYFLTPRKAKNGVLIHHLIIDESTATKGPWAFISEKIATFLSN